MTDQEIEDVAMRAFNAIGRAHPSLHLGEYIKRLRLLLEQVEIEIMATKDMME